jgi:hypothetical protein
MPSTLLAYKFVAVAAMLAEINFCAPRLHLQEHLPVKYADIRVEKVFDPSILNFAGRIDTENYSFCFVKSGRLRFITKLDAPGRQSMGIYRGNESMPACIAQLSQMKSMISSNDAYRLATNWLVAMSVDVRKLEAKAPPQVEQQSLEAGNRGVIPVPLFYVKWGAYEDPAVDVMISGVTGELLNLRQENDAYSRRPALLIKNQDELLAIPDAEFLKYTEAQWQSLLARSLAVDYGSNFMQQAASRTAK